jgi:DNA gyrase subunit A
VTDDQYPADGSQPGDPADAVRDDTAAGGTPPAADPPSSSPTDTRVESEGAVGLRVEPIEIEEELQRSYLDYAMSVIVGRALPESRDGLKPVHRRILFSMYEGGMRAGSSFRKSAAAVGDVMKKYHPHGDSAIYDALVRMAQGWAIRYPLIQGHGNFGSMDGDSAAAMRYTEARLSPLAMELLRDIDEDTVDFVDNYDGQEVEPVVLPSRFPNLLVNGSAGIAVGMATNAPPHNLREVTAAIIAQLANPDITLDELMRIVPGPDFPTGAHIMGTGGIREAYETGRGSIRMRAVSHVEETSRGEQIVVTEVPYQVNKANVAVKIADLVRDKRISGIRDLNDESNREGVRLVIELRRDANAQVVLNQLYKMTQLQETFGVINLSLVDGVPRTLSLKATIQAYIDHQVEIITRRTSYRLRRAEERAHVLEGLIVALDNLDEVIALIRNSRSADTALGELQERFELSEIQARAILDMQLRRLAALERQKILDEYAELQDLIADLRDILARPERVRQIIVDELTELTDRFGDDRRTRILPGEGDLDMEDLIPEEEVVVTLTEAGYLKRTKISEYRTQRRGGKGVVGTGLRDDDLVRDLFVTTTHHILLFFTNQGRVYRIKAWQIPEKSRTAKGTYIASVEGLALEPDESVAAVVYMRDFEEIADHFLVFGTRQGMVKRTELSEYDSPRSVLIAINLREGDELIGVQVTSGEDEIILVSRRGMAIRFHESDARAMGRDTTGVIGMNLDEDDEVLSMTRAVADGQLLVVTDEGYGKRTPLERYPLQRRGGKGVKTAQLTDTRGGLVGALVAAYEQEIFIVTDTGTIIRMDVKDIRPTGRATQGVRVMKPSDGAKVASIAPVMGEELDDE